MVRRYNSKDRGSVPEINWSHPLATKLELCVEFLEHGGNGPIELVHRIKGVKGGTPLYSPRGVEMRSGTSSYYSFAGISDTKFVNTLTLIWRGVLYSTGTYHHFAGKHAGGGGSANPFDFRSDNGTPSRAVMVREGTSDTGPVLPLNKVFSVVWDDPRPNPGRSKHFFVNGIKTTDIGFSGWVTTGSSADLRIGRRADGGVQLVGTCQFFRAWSRGLLKDEVRWMEEEPYALFNFPVKRFYLVLPGASGGLDVSVSDSLNNWLDSASASVAASPFLSVEAFDSMFYNIFDEFTYGSSLTNLTSSDQMSMSDSVAVTGLRQDILVGDSLSFVDSLNLSLLSSRAFADSMSMSDSLLMRSNILLGVGESLNFWSDAGVSSGPATNLGQAVSDTMNFWSDSVNGLSSTAETNYLRQYLNDVIN